jgi:protein CpxP
MGGGYGPGAMMGGGYGPGAMMGAYGPGANADAWLEQYKARLQITPAQEGAWTAYTKKSQEQFEAMRTAHEAMFTSMQDPKLTAPERAALMSALMQQRAGAMASSAAALKDLYAALSPEQRALIDQGPRAGRRR